MINIMVFAGTTEGRELCEKYVNQNIIIDVYTATEYGSELLPQCENIRVHSGRLDSNEIISEIRSLDPFLVIDATHPYAVEISRNIKEAAGDKYIRLLREEHTRVKALYADSIDKAVSAVNRSRGNILVTTGSKDIERYTAIKDYKNRCILRMLPDNSNIEKAVNLGFPLEHIIAEKGPFTKEQNKLHINKYNIKYLITKESGQAGGFDEKYRACQDSNVAMIVIKRPYEEGHNADAVYNIIEETKNEKQIYIIGIGLGNPDTMTIEAYKHIQRAELVIGARRMVESADTAGKDICYEYNAEKIKSVIDKCSHNRIAVLFSGDVCIHSGAIALSKILADYDTRVIQGISSVTYLASRLGIGWAGAKVLSLHGVEGDIVKTVSENKSVFVLTSGNVSEICQRLCEGGFDNVHICVGERLSYNDERILAGYPKDFEGMSFDSVTIMYVENLHYGKTLKIGIDDDEFIRGRIPMTKSEVRTLILSEMGIKESSVIYDIGAGTGSVSIECAKFAKKVYAIEAQDEAVDLIIKNREKFNASNIDIIKGYAKDVLYDLPKGDIAFIGGSKGQLEDIVKILYKKGTHKIVMTAIAIESVANMISIAKEYNMSYNVKQVAVSRGKKVSDITMMMGENPIYIVTAMIPEVY